MSTTRHPCPHFPPLTFRTAITTVGYGEITPRSFLGRVITLPLLVFGLLLIALPTFVLGREFSIVWEFMEEAQVSLALLSCSPQLSIDQS